MICFKLPQGKVEIGKKNQVKAKQHPEAEDLLFENPSLSSATLSCKNNMAYSKSCKKTKQVRLLKWVYVIIAKENDAENENWIT